MADQGVSRDLPVWALCCALIAMFFWIAIGKGTPNVAHPGASVEGAVQYYATYLGYLLGAGIVAGLLVVILSIINTAQKKPYPTPRRDFVIAAAILVLLIMRH